MRHKVLGFAMVLHEPDINFCFLDWIATARDTLRGGLGSTLYERVRAECAALKVSGLFFECLPDTPGECNPDLLRDNIARLRFYERYGARPIAGTGYETPVSPEDTCMPHLVYDDLGTDTPLTRSHAKNVVQAILERKYKDLCPPEYVTQVVGSIRDNPVKLRPFCHVRPHRTRRTVQAGSAEKIALVLNQDHEIHHIHERGYVESPVRIARILSHLKKSGLFETLETRSFTDTHIRGVHDADFIDYLARACEEVAADKSLYPYVFPIRNKTRPPRNPRSCPATTALTPSPRSTETPGLRPGPESMPYSRQPTPCWKAGESPMPWCGLRGIMRNKDRLADSAISTMRPLRPGIYGNRVGWPSWTSTITTATGSRIFFTTGQISSPYPSTATLRLPILISPDFQMKPAQAKAKVSISICPWTKPWTAKPSERL